MVDYRACREAYSTTILQLAIDDPSILVVSSDARGSCGLNSYVDTLPEQFVEIGIAEQNEIGIAAGLSAVGLKPYVCAPACFLTARSLEQIKVDVAYSHQNVKILGVSGGVSYGALGASHHTLHDIAALRCFPDLDIMLPSDATQTIAILKEVSKTNRAAYIRIGREKVPVIYDPEKEGESYTYGKANTLVEGSDVTIIACGETVYHSREAARTLLEKGVSARVLDMATLKPLDTEAILKAAGETGRIVTVEEHSINGGLGAAVSQVVGANNPVPVLNLGFPDEYLITGTGLELFNHYGLDAQGIAEQVFSFCNGK